MRQRSHRGRHFIVGSSRARARCEAACGRQVPTADRRSTTRVRFALSAIMGPEARKLCGAGTRSLRMSVRGRRERTWVQFLSASGRPIGNTGLSLPPPRGPDRRWSRPRETVNSTCKFNGLASGLRAATLVTARPQPDLARKQQCGPALAGTVEQSSGSPSPVPNSASPWTSDGWMRQVDCASGSPGGLAPPRLADNGRRYAQDQEGEGTVRHTEVGRHDLLARGA